MLIVWSFYYIKNVLIMVHQIHTVWIPWVKSPIHDLKRQIKGSKRFAANQRFAQIMIDLALISKAKNHPSIFLPNFNASHNIIIRSASRRKLSMYYITFVKYKNNKAKLTISIMGERKPAYYTF